MEISSHSGTTSISTETSVSSTSNTQQHETRKRTSPSANDSGGNDVSVSATEEQPASKMPKLEGSKSEEKDAQTGDTETPVQQKTEDNENDESSDDEDEDSEEDQVEIPLKELNKQLVCPLCDQYFRDAHTITDCLHTFCKICIVQYCASVNSCCPLCQVDVDPVGRVKPDTVIQGIVDTVLSSESLREFVGDGTKNTQEPADSGKSSQEESNNSEALSSEQKSRGRLHSGSMRALRDYRQKPMQYISMKLEPVGKCPQLPRPYLRTVGSLTVRALIQYLSRYLKVPYEKIELFCRDMPLRGKEHQLLFISRTMWRTKTACMVLRYELKH